MDMITKLRIDMMHVFKHNLAAEMFTANYKDYTSLDYISMT